MVTLKQIADELGVSIRTVSIALNGDPVAGRISETCVNQIKQVAHKRGYQVSAAARAIRLKRTRQIGILVRNNPHRPLIDQATYETILGINQQLEQAGYVVCLIRYTDVANKFASGSRVFRERVLDGAIVIGNIPDPICKAIQKSIKTCVWVDNNDATLPHAIGRDEYHAGHLAADHVCRLGYKHVQWMGPTPDEQDIHYSVFDRYHGVYSRMTQAGITPSVRLLPHWNPEVTLEDLRQSFTQDNCIIAYNTDLAFHLSNLVLSMGYRAGYDFGLVCCEDSYYARETWPGLSRVSFDRYAMGQSAADLMLQILQDKSQNAQEIMRFPVHWMPGNTAWGPKLTVQ